VSITPGTPFRLRHPKPAVLDAGHEGIEVRLPEGTVVVYEGANGDDREWHRFTVALEGGLFARWEDVEPIGQDAAGKAE